VEDQKRAIGEWYRRKLEQWERLGERSWQQLGTVRWCCFVEELCSEMEEKELT
jgi:hypothetical protein